MVEVFKTNVTELFHAEIMVKLIHKSFKGSDASFDLEDCDKILRVESFDDVNCHELMNLVKYFGFKIEILSDEINSLGNSDIL
jgi:hypothetical protein